MSENNDTNIRIRDEYYQPEDLAKDVRVPIHRTADLFRKKKYGIVELCDSEGSNEVPIGCHPKVDEYIPNQQSCEAFSIFQAANTLVTDVINMIDHKAYENFDYDEWWIQQYSTEYHISEEKVDGSGNKYVEAYVSFMATDEETEIESYVLEMVFVVFEL